MKQLQVAEVARLAGVSRDTLRYYERRGLLPRVPRAQNGYRQYPASVVERVLVIRRALEAGFSIAELAKVLKQRDSGRAPCREVYAMAQEHLAELEARVERLVALREELRAMIHDWERRIVHLRPGERAKLLEALPAFSTSSPRESNATQLRDRRRLRRVPRASSGTSDG